MPDSSACGFQALSSRSKLKLQALGFRRCRNFGSKKQMGHVTQTLRSEVSSDNKQGKFGRMNHSFHIQALLSGWFGESLVKGLPALACTCASLPSLSSTVTAKPGSEQPKFKWCGTSILALLYHVGVEQAPETAKKKQHLKPQGCVNMLLVGKACCFRNVD